MKRLRRLSGWKIKGNSSPLESFTKVSSTMKKAILIVSVFSIFILGQSCRKDGVDPEPDDLDKIGGSVILPEGVKIGGLHVTNGNDFSPVSNGKYSIRDTESDFAFTFLNDRDGEVILMGYKYPGQVDFDISITSTALGLVMASPSFLLLNKQGKIDVISYLRQSNRLGNLEKAISNAVKNRRSIFHEADSDLASQLLQVFSAASSRVRQSTTIPVNTFRAANELTFVNNGRAHKTIVGIYKDGVRQKYQSNDFLEIKNLEFVPKSISEIIEAISHPNLEIPEYKYAMQGDGKFEFKYSTGLPGEGDGSDEWKKAFNENVLYGLAQIADAFLKDLISFENKCYSVIASAFANRIEALHHYYVTKNVSPTEAVLEVFGAVFLDEEQVKNLARCIRPNKPDHTIAFLRSVGRLVKYIDFVTKSAAVGNVTLLSWHWMNSVPSYEKCYTISGGKVEECEDNIREMILSGGLSPEAEIGADDDFEIYLNGVIVFQNMDGESNGSPPFKIKVKNGDTLRIVGYNTIPPCAILTPFYLHFGGKFQLLTLGYPQNCGVPTGVFFDESFRVNL